VNLTTYIHLVSRQGISGATISILPIWLHGVRKKSFPCITIRDGQGSYNLLIFYCTYKMMHFSNFLRKISFLLWKLIRNYSHSERKRGKKQVLSVSSNYALLLTNKKCVTLILKVNISHKYNIKLHLEDNTLSPN
jgi:hypothetical protein